MILKKAYSTLLMTLGVGMLVCSCKKEGVAVSEVMPAKEAVQTQVAASSDTSVVADPFLLSSISNPVGHFTPADFGVMPYGLPNATGDNGVAIGQPTGMVLKVNSKTFVLSKSLHNDPVVAFSKPALLPMRPIPEMTIEGGDKDGFMKVQITFLYIARRYQLQSCKLIIDGDFYGRASAVYFSAPQGAQYAKLLSATIDTSKEYASAKGTFDAEVSRVSGLWAPPGVLRLSGSFNIESPKL
ncbi:hypothetical protein HH214_06490 [Mucilaginibacter robiniae]|uniref:Uncharacterized protein n=1 Tax=Mucilaginibacter robiniae TaxID=2728022 RepID=A0A7L5E1U2_9SPHI|nr:hypothetical protein [Mucilaginibacter robiniae]QJD95544.1 hypothetical protein HH214_06490 [Mucilaginibacter robiniae]